MVLHSDTTVEIPIVLQHVKEVMRYLKKRGIKTMILDDIPNFFTTMLKHGYGFPRWNFRQCCRIYKYGRALRYLKSLGKIVLRGIKLIFSFNFLCFSRF